MLSKFVFPITEQIEGLGESDLLQLMKWLYDREPHKWDYVTMSDPLKRFYNSDEKRS